MTDTAWHAFAILLSAAILCDLVSGALRSWRPWPEPRAHHPYHCGGSCPYSSGSAEAFALHREGQHRALEGVDYPDGPAFGAGTAPSDSLWTGTQSSALDVDTRRIG